MTFDEVTQPQIGDLAEPKGGMLGRLRVVEISPDGARIRLAGLLQVGDWTPARFYSFTRGRAA